MREAVYIAADGFQWLVLVKQNTTPDRYRYGKRIGPPDLTRLPLKEEVIKDIQADLVHARIVNKQLLRGNTRLVHDIVARHVPGKDVKTIVRWIKSLYQGES